MTALSSSTSSTPDEYISAILSGQSSVLDLVESLQPLLVSSDASQREEAIEKIAKVIQGLPEDTLSSSEVKILLEFFCSKLKDSVLLASPSIRSLHHLVISSKNCPKDAQVDVLGVLLRDQEVQSCPQSDRILVFQVLDHVIDTNADAIRNVMASEFILGFLQSADGERDPRCLMNVFKIFCKILEQIPLGPFASDMFEMVACYFPIDFKPPPNDPYGIKPEQLGMALRRCLTGHPGFSNVCLDLISEKFMEEEDDKARKEIWTLLNDGLQVFGTEVINTYATGLWQHIRAQALKPQTSQEPQQEPDAAACTRLASQALGIMSKRLCQIPGKDKVKEIAEKMFHDCEPFLVDIEMHLLKPASDILMSAARREESVCVVLCGKVIPLLMERVQKTRTLVSGTEGVWDELRDDTQIMPSIRIKGSRGGTGSGVAQAQYAPVLAAWIELAKQMNSGWCVEYLVEAFVSLVLSQLSRSLLGVVVEAGLDIARNSLSLSEKVHPTDSQKMELAEAALSAFTTVSGPDAEGMRRSCVNFFRELSKLCWPLVEKDILPRVVTQCKLSSDLSPLFGSLIHDNESYSAVMPEILGLFHFEESVPSALCAIQSVLEWNPAGSEVVELMWKPVLESLFACAKQDLSPELIKEMSVCAQDVFLSLKPGSESEEGCVDKCFELLDNDENVFGLIEPILCSVTPSVSSVISERISACVANGRVGLKRVFRIRASLANKMPCKVSQGEKEDDAEKLVKELREAVRIQMETDKQGAILHLGILTKALMLRNLQPHGLECLRQLFDLLNESEEGGEYATRACRSLYDDSLPSLINPERTRAIGTFLHRQRILSQSVPLFLDSYSAPNKDNGRQYYFVILGQLLQYAPQGSIMDLAKLVPVLIRALDQGECRNLDPVVSALKQLLSTTETAVPLEGHLDTVTDRLLLLASSHKTLEMRVKSVECLGFVGVRFAPSTLYPLKKKVLKGLSSMLDDHKRLVRKAAVEAINKWSLFA